MPIMDYASVKYQNTLKLLGQAQDIKKNMEQGRFTMPSFQKTRFEDTLASLRLKEQVLGYLEDLTQGTFHRVGLDKDSLTQYSEWLLSETPVVPFPNESSPQAYARLQWLRGYISGSDDPDKARQEILRTLYVESRTEVNLSQVENLVLAGGGAKALSLAGVIQSIEEYQRSQALPLKRVAGTSGGAIMAMGYAVGFSGKELSRIVMQNAYGLFTMESRLGTPWLERMAHWFARDKPDHPLYALSDNVVAHFYHDELITHAVDWLVKKGKAQNKTDCLAWIEAKPALKDDRIARIINAIPSDALFDVDCKAQRKTVKEYPFLAKEGGLHFYASPRQALGAAFRHKVGLDVIRGFFSDLIVKKVAQVDPVVLRQALVLPAAAVIQEHRLRDLTFKELHRLHELQPDTFKELHISMCIQQPLTDRFKGKTYNRYRYESASHQHAVFADLPVADAVRVSMNLPWIYPAYPITVKGKTFLGSDGGLISNMSLSTFDQHYAPEKTLGVFYKTQQELMTIYDVNRILVLPRSEDAIKQEIVGISSEISRAEEHWSALRQQWDAQSSTLKEGGPEAEQLRIAIYDALEAFRVSSGKLSALQRELSSLSQYDTPAQKWWGSLSFKSLLDKYLSKNNREAFGETHDLKRLVMINTGKVNTKNFKLSHAEKEEQIRYGHSAMNALLRGTYCLENHFYFHMLLNISYTNGVQLNRFNIHTQADQAKEVKSEALKKQFDVTGNASVDAPPPPDQLPSVRSVRRR